MQKMRSILHSYHLSQVTGSVRLISATRILIYECESNKTIFTFVCNKAEVYLPIDLTCFNFIKI
ncbi:hypothetical protein T10_6847 [Trichinella papuae]|uniref:Uncharacterized protein n=1 Tax=Trichinella papuae TaxID=268474 RepID=A0A0V1M9I7_9BILA|nr:hypothetical protein T10_6847 [Trichinella papuae]